MQDAPGVLAILGAVALMFLGLMQYIAKFFKANSEERTKIFDKYETTRLDNIELMASLRKRNSEYLELTNSYKDMKVHAQRYYKLYKKYEGLYAAESTKKVFLE